MPYIFLILFVISGKCFGIFKSSPSQGDLKSGNMQEVPQEQIDQIVIKGKELKVDIKGTQGHVFKVLPSSSTLNVFKSKNKRVLIVQGTQDRAICQLEIPSSVHVQVSGGKIHVTLNHMNGNLTLEGGDISCESKGNLLNVRGRAGKAFLHLDGIRNDFDFSCGIGNFNVHYTMSDYLSEKKAPGLTSKRAPVVALRAAKIHKSFFYFPAECEAIAYRPMLGVHSDFPPLPRGEATKADVRVLIYAPPSETEVYLKKEPKRD